MSLNRTNKSKGFSDFRLGDKYSPLLLIFSLLFDSGIVVAQGTIVSNVGARDISSEYWLSGDFNGDGTGDLVNIYGVRRRGGLQTATAAIHESTPRGFQRLPGESEIGEFVDRCTNCGVAGNAGIKRSKLSGQQWVVGDFNGDGKDDVVAVDGVALANGKSDAQVSLYISSGKEFKKQSDVSVLKGYSPSQQWIAIDINGDGKDDLLNLYSGRDSSGLVSVRTMVHHSDGRRFEQSTAFYKLAGNSNNEGASETRARQPSGDRLAVEVSRQQAHGDARSITEQALTPSKDNYDYKARSFVSKPWSGTLDNVFWNCISNNCYGLIKPGQPRVDPGSIIHECGTLSYKIGGLADFQPRGENAGPMTESTLAKCNSGVKIGPYRKYYYSADLGKELRTQQRTVLDKKYDINWKCSRSQCWAFIEQTAPSWHHCRELKRQVGMVTGYWQKSVTYGQKFLEPSLLDKCNA